MAQSPAKPKAAVPTPSRVADGGLLAVPGTVVRCIGAQSSPLPAAGASPRPTQRNQSACGKWQLPTSGGTHRCRPTFFIGGAFMFAVWHIMAPRRPPRRGGGGGHGLRPGVAPSADGAGDDREFRPLQRAGISRLARRDQRLCLWKPRFGQRAAGWQEVSARNFVSEQGAASPPYWMYGKKLRRSYGAKGPATPADTPVVSCPTEKNRVKLFIFGVRAGRPYR